MPLNRPKIAAKGPSEGNERADPRQPEMPRAARPPLDLTARAFDKLNQLVDQIAIATSAIEPTAASTGVSTASAPGASVRSVHAPSPAKNRK